MDKHKRLVTWKNIEELSDLIHLQVCSCVPKMDYKLRDQIERATTSIGANYVEGYYSGSTKEFIRFLGYCRRSLAELGFWVAYCRTKKYVPDDLYASVDDLAIRTGYLLDRLILSLKEKINNLP